MNNFFTKRRIERENYKILKSIKANSVSFYRVAFKRYLFGWRILRHKVDDWPDRPDYLISKYDTKVGAKSRIEEEIDLAYKKMANTIVDVVEVNED